MEKWFVESSCNGRWSLSWELMLLLLQCSQIAIMRENDPLNPRSGRHRSPFSKLSSLEEVPSLCIRVIPCHHCQWQCNLEDY
jgi:hypothetical protein